MKKVLFLILIFLIGCNTNNPNIVEKFPQDQSLERKEYAGNMFGNKEGIIIFEDKDKKENNEKFKDTTLWRKSIIVISNILPISIADENSGLITTEWGKIAYISGDENLYKINLTVSGKKIDRENLKVSVFKKYNDTTVKDENVEKKIIDMIL